MEDTVELLRELKRHLNSIEHMIYVSCKFTRTTEMLRKVMESMVSTYEYFFGTAFRILVPQEEASYVNTVQDKIQLLREALLQRGIDVDISDYFLLKRLLLSEFDCIGEYRKNLCMVSYIDGEEYVINMSKLLDFYENLKLNCNGLTGQVH